MSSIKKSENETDCLKSNQSALLSQFGSALSADAKQTLSKMYSSSMLEGIDGQVREVGETFISARQGSELHRVLREANARSTLEIGFALGFSTIWILDAVTENGRHEAIDPYENSFWNGVGLKQVSDTGDFAQRFAWHADRSVHKLSDFIKEGRKFDAVFIDGSHLFDDVMLDFHLSDQVLDVGGILALDDIYMNAVRAVANFIVTNRSYEVVENQEANMLVLRKTGADGREWDHFEPFHVPGNEVQQEPARALFPWRRRSERKRQAPA